MIFINFVSSLNFIRKFVIVILKKNLESDFKKLNKLGTKHRIKIVTKKKVLDWFSVPTDI
jgi:hypothetical protein